eukprot:4310191-Ditylum_brightwellii.AAC.1
MHSTTNHSTTDRRTEKIPHHTLLPDDSDHLDEECTLETLDENEEARAAFWQEQTNNENAHLFQHGTPKQLIQGISQISSLLSVSLSHWEQSSRVYVVPPLGLC